jgi:hypothetical protein
METASRIVLGTLIAAVLLPGVLIGQVKSDEPVRSVRISGRVEDSTTAPFVKMAVVLKPYGRPDVIATTETDQNGVFTFDVPANTYDLHFQAPGFMSVVKMVRAFGPDSAVGTVRLQVAPTFSPTVVATTSGFAQGQSNSHSQEKQAKLWAAISVQQPIFKEGGEADRLQMYFGVYNDGNSAIGPNVESSRLLINGVEQQDWPYIIGGGIRNELFSSLPPGETLQFTYLLGERYFKKPGIYTVRWEARISNRPS